MQINIAVIGGSEAVGGISIKGSCSLERMHGDRDTRWRCCFFLDQLCQFNVRHSKLGLFLLQLMSARKGC